MSKSTRIRDNPGKKTPKEELESLPSIFVDREKIEKICEEVREGGKIMLPYASEHVLRAVVHLAAMGLSNKLIGVNLGIPPRRVEVMLKSESVRQEIERLQIQAYNRDAEAMFKRLVPSAVQNIFDLMTKKSHKENTRLEAAKYIVDRALGKPKEIREEKIDLLGEVFKDLHKPKDQNPLMNQTIEAEFETVTDKQSDGDPLESLLSDNN